MQNNYSKENDVFAGFFARVTAFLIDSLIAGSIGMILRFPVWIIEMLFSLNFLNRPILFIYTPKSIFFYLCTVFYFVFLTYVTGSTFGKKIMNLCVISVKDELTVMDVLYRETIGRFLSGVSFGLGYIIVGLDKEKRGIHDMLCDTRVVYEKKIKVSQIYPTRYAGAPVQPGTVSWQEQPVQQKPMAWQEQPVQQEAMFSPEQPTQPQLTTPQQEERILENEDRGF